jgi:hypothetical protein
MKNNGHEYKFTGSNVATGCLYYKCNNCGTKAFRYNYSGFVIRELWAQDNECKSIKLTERKYSCDEIIMMSIL